MVDKNKEKIDTKTWLTLAEQAKQASYKAYAPYSHFNVGAAALMADNSIVQGCNVENASYGLTICAERNCIAHAVITHPKNHNTRVEFKAIVIYTEQEKLTPPCGACRQVISEFFPANAQVMATNHLNKQKIWSVQQLLPDAFLPKDLLEKN